MKAYSVFASAAELNPVFDCARAVLNELDLQAVPTVAAINGRAIVGGFELALACEFRIAHASVTLSLPQVRMSILPGWFATERLLAICGRANAKRIALSGARIPADEALRLGAIDLVADADVVEAAIAFLKQFKAADRRGVRTLSASCVKWPTTTGSRRSGWSARYSRSCGSTLNESADRTSTPDARRILRSRSDGSVPIGGSPFAPAP